jgi:hypothetical protein
MALKSKSYTHRSAGALHLPRQSQGPNLGHPSDREQYLMDVIGFDRLENLVEWLNAPLDPKAMRRLEASDMEDEIDPEDLLPDPPEVGEEEGKTCL